MKALERPSSSTMNRNSKPLNILSSNYAGATGNTLYSNTSAASRPINYKTENYSTPLNISDNKIYSEENYGNDLRTTEL